ncbi:hypothetical protein PR048_031527 [Dryococelus australis]|uniref:Uncharacterized protein n=1 Tax=Dryococelus australis TaxID=614101 RepID=A0ABQ9G5J7_9NEOP|nr:hypothetical protein PR048_031527 [Dryococelus australis]
MEQLRNERTGEKREIPEKTHRSEASSSTIPTCGNLGVALPGIDSVLRVVPMHSSPSYSNTPCRPSTLHETLVCHRLASSTVASRLSAGFLRCTRLYLMAALSPESPPNAALRRPKGCQEILACRGRGYDANQISCQSFSRPPGDRAVSESACRRRGVEIVPTLFTLSEADSTTRLMAAGHTRLQWSSRSKGPPAKDAAARVTRRHLYCGVPVDDLWPAASSSPHCLNVETSRGSHPVWHALHECLQDIHGNSSPFILQPFHELSNGFWPRLTSPHSAIQFVPKMFYRVEAGALGGPVQSANIVVDWLDCSPPTKANRVRFPAGSPPDSRMWESCRAMPLVDGFSRGSPVYPAPAFRRCYMLASSHPHQLSRHRLGEVILPYNLVAHEFPIGVRPTGPKFRRRQGLSSRPSRWGPGATVQSGGAINRRRARRWHASARASQGHRPWNKHYTRRETSPTEKGIAGLRQRAPDTCPGNNRLSAECSLIVVGKQLPVPEPQDRLSSWLQLAPASSSRYAWPGLGDLPRSSPRRLKTLSPPRYSPPARPFLGKPGNN